MTNCSELPRRVVYFLASYQLGDENERRKSSDLLLQKTKEQLAKKEEQYTQWVHTMVLMLFICTSFCWLFCVFWAFCRCDNRVATEFTETFPLFSNIFLSLTTQYHFTSVYFVWRLLLYEEVVQMNNKQTTVFLLFVIFNLSTCSFNDYNILVSIFALNLLRMVDSFVCR